MSALPDKQERREPTQTAGNGRTVERIPVVAQFVSLDNVDAAFSKLSPSFTQNLIGISASYSSGEIWELCRTGKAFLIAAHDGKSEIKAASAWRFENWPQGTVLNCLVEWSDGSEEFAQGAYEIAKTHAMLGGAKQVCMTGPSDMRSRFPRATVARVTLIEGVT